MIIKRFGDKCLLDEIRFQWLIASPKENIFLQKSGKTTFKVQAWNHCSQLVVQPTHLRKICACENWIISPKIGPNKIYQMIEVSLPSDSHLLPSFCPRQSSGPLSCCLNKNTHFWPNHSGTKHWFSSFERNYVVCQNHGFLIYPVIWVHHVAFSAAK